MIQRIQTIYLLAIVILSGFVIFSPLADLIDKTNNLIYFVDYHGISILRPNGIFIESSVWGLTTISSLVPILAFSSIFLYKNRSRQIQSTIVNMVILFCFYAVLALYLSSACVRLHTEWHLRAVTVIPVVNLILSYLAIVAIRKDDKLVKSLDRLR